MIRNPPGDDTARNARVRWIAQTNNRITNFEFSGMTALQGREIEPIASPIAHSGIQQQRFCENGGFFNIAITVLGLSRHSGHHRNGLSRIAAFKKIERSRSPHQ